MHDAMTRMFSSEDAEILGQRALSIGEGAEALSRFAQESPELAQMAGVEVSALEARSILQSGSVQRVIHAAMGSAQARRAAAIGAGDLEAMTRLENVLALSGSRISASVQALDQQKARGGMDTLGSVIGLATGAIGLWKAIF